VCRGRQFRRSELSGPGRGWALWKALITHAGDLKINPVAAAKARCVVDDVLAAREH
jgi:hypothetical protein